MELSVFDIGGLLAWWIDEIKAIWLWLFEKWLSAFAFLIESIPVPDFAESVPSVVSAVPGEVWFFASVGQLDYGAGVVGVALSTRFFIRRLPVVG